MKPFWSLALLATMFMMVGCPDSGGGPESGSTSGGSAGGEELRGKIVVDGSSTVGPIAKAVIEQFAKLHPDVRVSLAISGSGAGLKKFAAGEIDICNASRKIKDSEVEACQEAGIDFVELYIAIDGLTVVVNPENDWVESLSTEDLKTIWVKGSEVKKWSDLGKEGYPEEEIKLFGPDADSGTFDYFTEEILGERGNIRSDYQPSANDNFVVTGVEGDKHALGYFGYAYYVENKDKVKSVAISHEEGEPVAPTPETIESGTYSPLSRPLFMYVRKDALKRRQVVAYLEYVLSDKGREIISETGYVRLSDDQMAEQEQKLAEAVASQAGE
ncbi:MAG: PstS family phosphate ABC transporter substrate-binding protein [Planctomycetaceae bacterium]|nr:PstS family phosphate ABC transporter substrate-binding protein [Planctomycetaceae bacterium]